MSVTTNFAPRKEYLKCHLCQGRQMVDVKLTTVSGDHILVADRCPECGGAGYVTPVDKAEERTRQVGLSLFVLGMVAGAGLTMAVGLALAIATGR